MSGDLNLIISDVHCRFAVVNSQIAHAEKLAGRPVDRVFVLGDLGFFQDEMHGWFRDARGIVSCDRSSAWRATTRTTPTWPI